ncbi:putative tail tubular protein B [uncultured Mediterranean phage uvMED]|nr:putative tail tubular protein B [uncultured Mediterranean phage uvMED]
MPRTTLALTSFVSGEFSPKMDGRTDFEKYSSGAKTLENFLVHPQGAATRRVGTQFIAEVKSSAAKTRLIPFEFSTTQTYILEFGNNYIRFFKDKGQILSGGSAYEISTPYLTAELFDIKFAQSADVMYITHPNHEVMKLSRTGHTSWTLAEVEFTDGPYLATNTTATTLTPASAGVASGVNITASAVTGINGGAGFQTTDVGRIISFNSGKAKITSRTSTTIVVCTITTAFASTAATANFNLGAFSDTTGHPSCVSFFEQRLVFAGTTDEPQTLFFSKAGDYENMTTGTNADDAMVYTIASNQVNAIRYMKAVRTLVVGTTGGEFTVSADGTDASITPTNITIKRQSSFGSANVDAIPAGNAILFLQKAKRKIRELQYNFDSDGYQAPDLTILNETVTDTGINEMSYQQEPGSNIWCVRDDGVLACLTYQRSENVIAWSRHIFGGVFGSGNAVCESVASISGTLTEDEVWVIVKRTINGATKRYVECFSDFDFDETSSTDFKFLDSHLSYSGSATTTLSGLAHLEGQTVSILADGAAHANKTVSSGAITLDRSATKACVGLSYDSILQTMRIEGGAAEGTSQGKTKRISKVVLRLFETVGVKVGPSLSNLETIPFRTTSSLLSNPVDTLLSGDKEIEFNDDYNSDGFIFIKQDQPLPCSILAIYPTLVTSDG